MECLITNVTEVGKSLWVPIERRIKYLVYYKTNVENLRNQVQDLEAKKIDLQNRVDESLRKSEEPTEEVRLWLQRATETETAARNIGIEESDNRRWLKGLCPDFNSCYQVGKNAVKMKLAIKELLDKGDFDRVSCVLPPPSVIPSHGDYAVGFECAEWAMRELMEALRQEDIRVIGVYGIGGVGKTTLMKRLNDELQTQGLFQKVIFVTVSNYPDMTRIQREIAERLGLKLDPESSQSVRADMLYKRLKQEKTVLIILDDVWNKLGLSELGIPTGTGHKGCKIVMTSRMESVCNQTGTQRNIEIKLLSEKESWVLFKEKAGEVVESPELQSVAKLVMSECKCLPLAIVTVGLTLRMTKDISIWKDALRALRSSVPMELEGLMPSMLSSLRFSYDFLKRADIKLCFLFCCLFPEDENIELADLFSYGIGEGFLHVDGILEDALSKMHAFVTKLKDCGLLLEGEYERHVKMHDVIRDVAISIGNEDEHRFLAKAGLGLQEWPNHSRMEECERISLMYNDIRELPAELVCPSLRTLLLQDNTNLKKIPANFFKAMPSLQVLDLSNTDIRLLPPSLLCLTNLRTLCLGGCASLRDVSLLGGMKKLEVLVLDRCFEIRELPIEISELTNLKLLDLTQTPKLERIPSGLISKLTRLQILLMRESFSGWDTEENLASFREVASLHHLTDLQVRFKTEEHLFKDFSGPWGKLNRFDILVRIRYDVFIPCRARRMYLTMSSPNFANWVVGLLKKTEEMCIEGCEGAESLDANIVGSDCLECLLIYECQQMEYLINFQKKVPQYAFPNLKKLYVENMPNLKEFCHGPIPYEGLFRNLRDLNVSKCNKFQVIFSYKLLQMVHNLENLQVSSCDELQKISICGKHAGEIQQEQKYQQQQVKEGHDHAILPKLQILILKNLPRLINIWEGGDDIPIGSLHNLKQLKVQHCKSLEILLPHDVAEILHQLEEIKIGFCQRMERLILPQTPPCLKNLRKLDIEGCQWLKYLFTVNFAQGLQQLEFLAVHECEDMKELIAKNDEDVIGLETCKGVFPRLKELELHFLPELTCFYPGSVLFDFHSLESIEIDGCPKLRKLPFGPHSVPNLRNMNCTEEWLQGVEWVDERVRSRLQSRLDTRFRSQKQGIILTKLRFPGYNAFSGWDGCKWRLDLRNRRESRL